MTKRLSSPVFVGRELELEALRAGLGRAAEGRAQGVLVGGDSGVGKTRLLQKFRQIAEGTGAAWLEGECVVVAAGELPFAPITAALRAVGAAELSQAAESAPDLARILPPRPPSASEPEELPPSSAGTASLGEFARVRMFEQFLSLLVDLGSERTVVLAIEDLHWADSSTRDLLSFLLRGARAAPLLLICTYRTDDLHRRHPLRPFLAEHRRLEWVDGLELRPFARIELEAQLEGILGAPPDPELTTRLLDRSEGNAFYSEELIAASADGKVLPSTVRDALMLRVEGLTGPTREILATAAIAGRRVPHALLEAVAGLPEPQLTAALREAVERQILTYDPEDGSYAFRHTLIAESIAADLLAGERIGLHHSIAEGLAANPTLAADRSGDAAGELAYHWRACHRLQEAFAASVEAGAHAERTCAFAEASRHFEGALELWDQVEEPERQAGTDRPALLLRAAGNASLIGWTGPAVALARSAVAGVDPTEEPVRAAVGRERLGHFLWLAGDSEGALKVLGDAVGLIPGDPPCKERARVLAAEGKMLMLHGSPVQSRLRCEEAIAIARDTGARAEEGHALNTLGCDLLLCGERVEAIERINEARGIAEECSAEDLGRAFGNLVEALDQDGRVEEAVRMGVEGIELLRPLGQHAWIAYVLGWVSSQLVRLGRLEEAQRFVAMGLDTPIEGIDLAILHCVGAEIELQRGHLAEARSELDRAERAAGRTTDTMIRTMLVDRLALLGVLSGETARAAELVERAIADRSGGEYLFYAARTLTLGMRAHADAAERARALGDDRACAQAERSGEAILERFEELLDPGQWSGSPPRESLARRELAEAEYRRLQNTPEPDAWERAAACWRDLGFPLELAYGRWRQAEAALMAGAPKAEAAKPMREAARLAEAAGASQIGADVAALARRARIALDGAPDPAPTRASASEAERFGLTDRELEVLALVAAGHTNPEIGAKLFISAKTASAHVSHILSKLDVRSRLDAATAAHRLGLLPSDDGSSPSSTAQ